MKKTEQRHCNYMLILYDEMSVFDKPYKDENDNIIDNRNVIKKIYFDDVIERIKSYCFIKNGHYYYIKHDKDILDSGADEEIHYHVIVQFPKGEYEEDISNLVYMPVKDSYFSCKIQNCSIKDSVLYLTHRSISAKKDSNKYKYPITDIITDNYDYIEKCYKGVSEEIDLSIIYDYIDDRKDFVYLKDVIRFSINNSLYAALRRSQYLIVRYVQEHNDRFIKILNIKKNS